MRKLEAYAKKGLTIRYGDAMIMGIKIHDVFEDNRMEQRRLFKETPYSTMDKTLCRLNKIEIKDGGFKEWERSLEPNLRIRKSQITYR